MRVSIDVPYVFLIDVFLADRRNRPVLGRPRDGRHALDLITLDLTGLALTGLALTYAWFLDRIRTHRRPDPTKSN
jgi:hypothetical protein